MKILIVDDQKENRYLLETMLKASGYEVASSSNGAEALKKLRADSFDMIISDILMPIMDGFQLCREVKGDEKLKDITFVFYTATYIDEKDEELALKLGADKFIRKPVEPDEFIKTIKGVGKDAEKGKIKAKKPPVAEEKEILKLYSERLVKKLEKKMLDLEREVFERKQAEESLQESETRLRTLFEAIPDTLLVHDDEGTILYINEIGAKQLEWSAKDLVGKNLREIVAHEQRALISEHIKETHKIGWSRFETTYVSRSGWQIEAEVNECPIKFGNKKFLLRVARDITTRKKAERALLEEKKFSDSIINSSPDIFFVIGDQGNTIKWNMGAEAITGYSASEIAKMNIFDFVAKEDKKIAVETIQEALTKGLASVEINVLSKSGKQIPFYIKGRSIKVGNTICLVCTGMDITERRQAEEALRKSEDKYRSILENIEEGYYEVDLAGNFTFFNDATCLILGYPKEELMGMNNRQYTDKENAKRLYQAFNEVYRTGKFSKGYDYEIIKKGGTKNYIGASILLQKDLSGKTIGFRGIIRDITERKKAEEEIRRGNERLKEALYATINAFASTVEVRDPYTSGHQQRATILASAIAEELDLAEERIEGIRMAGLIHDIGKIIVPAEILSKPGPLTELQYTMVKMHPQVGHDMLKEIKFPWPIAEIVLQHHERMDGSGYPHGVRGEEIILEARILAVADVVEAMSSHRPYRPSLGIDKALEEISQKRGVLYDPKVVDTCVRLFAEKGFKLEKS
jgi:PAS domain S-box-containing protein/putative nucleotidyltransferase with HDIG domain